MKKIMRPNKKYNFPILSFRTLLIFFLLYFTLQRESVSQNLFFEKVDGQTITPNTPVHGITKDSLGYIWMGSWNGLYRYDGMDFKLYRNNPEDNHSIPNNRIRNIITDEEENVWILTFENQMVKYDYKKDVFHVIPDRDVNENVINLLHSSYNSINREKIIDSVRYYLSSNHLTSLDFKTNNEHQYFSSFWKPGALIDDYITSFYIDDQEIIWLGSRSGNVYKANTNRNPFHLNRNYINKESNPFPTAIRTILYQRKDERLWLGTNHNGMSIKKNGNIHKDHPYHKSDSPVKQVRSLHKDETGNIWIGGVSGLECYMPETNTSKPIINRETHPELQVWSVFSIAKSGNNKIWAGLYNGLALINTDNHNINTYDLENIVQHHSVMDILENDKGDVWLATEGNGIVRLKFNNEDECIDSTIVNSTSDSPISGDLIYSLYEDSSGNVWAGTSNGLSCINPDDLKVQNYTKNEGLSEDYISTVTGDESGNIWVSHKKGLSRLNPATDEIKNFSFKDKSNNWVFLDGALYNDTLENRLFFGAREGYVVFDPDSIKAEESRPQLVLETLKIGGRAVKPDDEIDGRVILEKVLPFTESITLGHNYKSFSVDMKALHHPNMEDIIYTFYLEGFDNEWRSSLNSDAFYTMVPPGKYKFTARAVSSDGNWSDYKELNIRILSPWYATKLAFGFYLFIIVSVLLLVYYIIKSRETLKNKIEIERLKVEKNEEINKEKLDFFTNISHEFKTPLTLIVDPLKQLRTRKLNENSKKLYLDIIQRNVIQLSQLINQLLDFRKAEHGKLYANYSGEDFVEITREVVESFEPTADQRNITFKFKHPQESLTGVVDKEKFRQIVYNILSNAFKYTPEDSSISVNLSQCDENIQLIVKDSGIGIPADSLEKIFEPFNTVNSKPFLGNSTGMGLSLTRKLVKILEGDILIESSSREGTTVKVILPLEPMENKALTKNELRKENVIKEQKANTPKTKPLILLVEDSKDIQEYLKNELSDSYDFMFENNGEDGYKNAVNNIPDLIISDIMMPKTNGLKYCRKIKNNEQTSHIPVILLTAKNSNESKVTGLNEGADAYVTKPFSVEVLKAQINSILENRSRFQKKLSQKKHISELENEENNLDNAFLNKVIAIVRQNIGNEDFTPEKLAGILEISQRQLYRKLKAVSGSTVHEFITRVRMDIAAEKLLNSDENISEIGYMVGFSEPSNFSRTFSKHFGCSPTRYIKTKT